MIETILAAAKHAVETSKFEGEQEDLIQIAAIGAIRAERVFDKTRCGSTNKTKENWMRLCAYRSLWKGINPKKEKLVFEKISPRQEILNPFVAVENRIFAEDLLKNLRDKRHRMVITLRFFADWTLQDVADLLQLTRERVRQIEEQALRVMREEKRK